MKKYYQLTQNGKSADLVIFGDITSWAWSESDVSAYNVQKEVADLDVDVINVHINSYGGEVAEGLAIYNTLKNHKATVTTVCDGFACSAASVVFMAGDMRIMNEASLLMIHNASSYAYGTSASMRKHADDLDVITGASKAAYMACVNITEAELTDMMDSETWIGPDDALNMGFATAIGVSDESDNATQSARKMVYDRLTGAKARAEPDAVDYERIGELIREALQTKEEPVLEPILPAAETHKNILEQIKERNIEI